MLFGITLLKQLCWHSLIATTPYSRLCLPPVFPAFPSRVPCFSLAPTFLGERAAQPVAGGAVQGAATAVQSYPNAGVQLGLQLGRQRVRRRAHRLW